MCWCLGRRLQRRGLSAVNRRCLRWQTPLTSRPRRHQRCPASTRSSPRPSTSSRPSLTSCRRPPWRQSWRHHFSRASRGRRPAARAESWTRLSGRRHSCRRWHTARWGRPRTRPCSTRSRWPGSRPWTTSCRTTWARAGCSAASTAASCSSSAACTSCTPRCTVSPARGSAASVTRSAPTRTSSRCTLSTSNTTRDPWPLTLDLWPLGDVASFVGHKWRQLLMESSTQRHVKHFVQ